MTFQIDVVMMIFHCSNGTCIEFAFATTEKNEHPFEQNGEPMSMCVDRGGIFLMRDFWIDLFILANLCFYSLGIVLGFDLGPMVCSRLNTTRKTKTFVVAKLQLTNIDGKAPPRMEFAV